MEKKLRSAILCVCADYKKLNTDFEKLKNLVTECLQNDCLNSHGTDIFGLITDIDYHLSRMYAPLYDAYNDAYHNIFARSKK